MNTTFRKQHVGNYNLRVGKDFLKRHRKHKQLKIDNLDYIKINDFGSSKDNKKSKMTSQELGEYFCNFYNKKD